MSQADHNREPRPEFLDELERMLTRRLAGHLAQLRVSESASGLVLTGSCTSYHAKQMAQEFILHSGNFRIIDNRLVVQATESALPDRLPEATDLLQECDTDFGSAIKTVFYPSGFAESGEVAFRHALRIAMANRGLLWMLNVDSSLNEESNEHEFPGIRQTLQRWGVIPENSPKSEIERLGFDVRKVTAKNQDRVRTCLEFLDFYQVDLVVLTALQHDSFMGWFDRTIGQPISRVSGQSTLFIPKDVEGFVASSDGSIRLKQVLIPITGKPCPVESMYFAKRLIENFGVEAGLLTLLHVGTSDTLPMLDPPPIRGWNWEIKTLAGVPSEQILLQAEAMNADLIIMTTDGPDRFIDNFLGTTSERVLKNANCPVVVLPTDSFERAPVD